jgi:hypothetical protein
MADSPKQFVRKMEKFNEIVGLRLGLTVKKVAFDAFSGLLKRSPVDEGRFRASWRIGINEPDTSVAPQGTDGRRVPPSNNAQVGKISNIPKDKDVTVHISNSLPYAQPLEDGHSLQAPDGVLLPTFVEVSQNIDRVIRSVTKEVPDA